MKPMPSLQRGAVLIEALTAATVFAFALLGHAALSAQMTRHLQDARYRSEAALIAQALIGRMAADDAGALATRYRAGGATAGDAAFALAVSRLPGSGLGANAPTIDIAPGPRAGSIRVAVSIGWQLPGTARPHRQTTTTIIGGTG